MGRGLSSAQVAAAVTSGAPGMPGFSGTLSGTQISAVSGYVAGLGTTTTAPGGSTTTGAPGSGGTLYGAYCSSCHGAGGGNLVGRGLSSAQVAAAVTSGAPGMPGFSGTLSSADIGAIRRVRCRYGHDNDGPGWFHHHRGGRPVGWSL